MTCIIGLKQGSTIFMGCDSAGVGGLGLKVRADRKVFKEKWGVGANDPAYENLFTEATFGIDKK